MTLLVDFFLGQACLDPGVKLHLPIFVGAMHFLETGEHHAFALGIDPLAGQVIQTEHHVLGRDDDRLAVGRAEDVVGGHH